MKILPVLVTILNQDLFCSIIIFLLFLKSRYKLLRTDDKLESSRMTRDRLVGQFLTEMDY